jgi:predicted transcriptional regulator
MPETKTIDTSLVAHIVRSYVARNSLSAAELPTLISTVHKSLAGLDAPIEAPPSEPAVPVKRSYNRNSVVCLDCGWRGQILRRHLTTAHNLSPREYRSKWNLKDTHPLTAPGYSERRSAMAKQLGLGRTRPHTEAALEPSSLAPKRRGRLATTPAALPAS